MTKLHMETTRIAPEKTVAEIQALLGSTGRVRAIQTEYDCDNDGRVAAICFMVQIRGQRVPFRLPARVDPIYQIFQSRRSYVGGEDADWAQAERTAWRIILRWIQAQLALIETGMVDIEEVFMPYVQTGIDQTLYQRFLGDVENGRLLLTGPQS